MTLFEIPISPIPSSEFGIILKFQECIIRLITRGRRLYFDIEKNGIIILEGRICQNKNPLVPYKYLDFSGNIYFVDTIANNDPVYNGLGSRYFLVYDDKIDEAA